MRDSSSEGGEWLVVLVEDATLEFVGLQDEWRRYGPRSYTGITGSESIALEGVVCKKAVINCCYRFDTREMFLPWEERRYFFR